jgi:fido (protein-threonine AMPylation protein)
MKLPSNRQIKEFLIESNAIEREYSEKALEDAKKAWRFALETEKFDLDYIKRIHRKLMRKLNNRIAGKFRKVPVYIGGEVRRQSEEDIKNELTMLLTSWHQTNLTEANEAEKIQFIKDWHINFEKIHPFEDGNGRTGRILMNIQRIYFGLPLLIIHAGTEEQDSYYKWFKEKI